MAKRTEEEEVMEMVNLSPKMKFDLIAEINKFKEYEGFLLSVFAMNEKKVTSFPNTEIEEYRNMFVKNYEHTTGDSFIFDKLTKIYTSTSKNGKPIQIETGYFCPRIFWDFVNRYNPKNYEKKENLAEIIKRNIPESVKERRALLGKIKI